MTNVDENEVKKFDQIASRWWDKNSEFKPLHDLNPLRLKFIEDNTSLTDKKVIDVGCGGGILSESMSQRGAIVTGIDLAKQAIQIAKLHAIESHLHIDYQQITAEAMAEQHPEQFDVVTCMELLEHVPDPASLVSACAKLTKPGGSLFFSTLNRNPKAYLLAIIGAEYVLRMLPKGTHDYRKFITPAELAEYTRHANLKTIEMKGLHYNPLSKQYKLTADLSVNYLVACRKVKT